MDIHQWHQHLGQENTASFIHKLNRLQGLKHQQHSNTFFIETPAHALPPIQKELRNIIHQFSVQLPNRMPS